jgi:hypothetical protein
MATSVSSVHTVIFQASLNLGKDPDDLKTAYATPLFKKRDKVKTFNYCPISLTPVYCKTLEHLIHSHIIKLEKHNILRDQQHGFNQK